MRFAAHFALALRATGLVAEPSWEEDQYDPLQVQLRTMLQSCCGRHTCPCCAARLNCASMASSAASAQPLWQMRVQRRLFLLEPSLHVSLWLCRLGIGTDATLWFMLLEL